MAQDKRKLYYLNNNFLKDNLNMKIEIIISSKNGWPAVFLSKIKNMSKKQLHDTCVCLTDKNAAFPKTFEP